MTTAHEPGDLRRLRANFAQALVEHDHLHEALGQFEAALEEAGEVPTTREIERHVQRINRRLLQDRLDGHLDRALASPDQAADALRCRPGTVRSLVARGMQTLRASMEASDDA